MKKALSILSILILTITLICCNTGHFLTDVTDIKLYNGDINAAKKEMSDFLTEFEKNISVNIKNSDISKINKARAGEPVAVCDDVIKMLKLSVKIYNETGGTFNPCIYPVLKLYDFNKKIVPDDKEISGLLPYTNINDLVITENTVTKKFSEMSIDLGGIAKGYAADRCLKIAQKHGVTSGIIDIGRNIYIIGAKSGTLDGEYLPFVVGITNPRPLLDKDDLYFGKINLIQTSAVTSGDYERYFIKDGIRYCHIINGITGKRPDSDLISVSVFGENSALCDAYSTALFVMGMSKAIKFALLNNLNVILIDDKNQYYNTESLNIYDINDSYKKYEQA